MDSIDSQVTQHCNTFHKPQDVMSRP